MGHAIIFMLFFIISAFVPESKLQELIEQEVQELMDQEANDD